MRGLKICLWVAAVGSLLSVAGVFLPLSVIESLATMLGMGPFPDSPVVVYALRTMSATYVGIGVFFVILALNPMKYGVLVPLSGAAAVFLGVACAIYGLLSGIPLWWFVGDALACTIVGILILLFWRRVKAGG